jgi:hypothetical protein
MLAPGRRPMLAPPGGGLLVGGATRWRWRVRRRPQGDGWSCLVEKHGGGDRALSSARRWTRMIVDGRGDAEVRCWESHEDRCPGEYMSRSHGRASSHVESELSPWVVIVSKCLSLWRCIAVEAWSSTYLDERIKFKCEVGGKPVYCARVNGYVPRLLAWLGSLKHT